jgi:hypothetical protein
MAACDKFVERGLPYGKCDITNPSGGLVSIRSLPSAKAGRVVATISNDTPVAVLDQSGNWLFIGEASSGWSTCDKLTDVSGTAEHQIIGPLHCANKPQ